MKQFVQRAGGRIGLWGGLLAAALAAFAAGWLVPARAPVGCKLNELTAAPDFSPFSPAAPAVATSDAGTPAISDPGFMLVRACVEQGVDVECLPGATAFVPALVNSGLPCDKFCFEGFLPQKKGRQTRLKELAVEPRTILFYESPFRLVKTLTQLSEFMGAERKVSVSREISKLHEETVRGTLSEVISHFSMNEPKGEIVIVLAGLNNKMEKEKVNEV